MSKTSPTVCMLIVLFFYLFACVARIEPSVLVNDLMHEFNMDSSMIGAVIATMYVPYIIMQLPYGIIIDKIGVKKLVVLCALLCSIGTFMFGMATNITYLRIARFLIGFASSAAFLCCGKVAGDVFDKSKYAMWMGIASFIGCLGGVVVTPVAYLAAYIGWRNATFIVASVGVFVMLLTVLLFNVESKHDEEHSGHEVFVGLKLLLKSPMAWIIGAFGAICYLPLSAIAELWGVPYISMKYGIESDTASIASALIFLGFGLGSVFSAYIAEKFNSCKKTIILFSICMTIIFLFILQTHVSFAFCLILMTIFGMFAGGSALVFALAIDIVPARYGGTCVGFINALVMVSGIVFQPLLGRLLDIFRNGMVDESGAPVYTLVTYNSALLVVAFTMISAIILAFFIKDVNPKNQIAA